MRDFSFSPSRRFCRRGFTRSTEPFGHVTFANIWGPAEKKGGPGPVGCTERTKEERQGGEGSDKANKASGVTAVANGSPARGDIGIESVYARQVLEERDRGRERKQEETKARARETRTRYTRRASKKEREKEEQRERMSKSEMPKGQPDRTLCQLSDLLVCRHGETLFTTKSLVDNAGYPRPSFVPFLFPICSSICRGCYIRKLSDSLSFFSFFLSLFLLFK